MPWSSWAVTIPIAAPAAAQTPPKERAFAIEVMSGHSLVGDGHGPYRDGEPRVPAMGRYALILCTNGRRCSTLPEAAPGTASMRRLVLNLREAVSGSGALPRGRRAADQAHFGAFWEQDTTRRATYNRARGTRRDRARRRGGVYDFRAAPPDGPGVAQRPPGRRRLTNRCRRTACFIRT